MPNIQIYRYFVKKVQEVTADNRDQANALAQAC